MFFIGMKITIPVTTSAKVAEGNPQMTFTESQSDVCTFAAILEYSDVF